MRTADPKNIKDDFLDGINDIENALDAVLGSNILQRSKNIVVEYSFLGAAILLEGFISDIFVAFINKNSGRFVDAMTRKMDITTGDELAKRAANFAKIDISGHLTLEKIRKILDPRGWNVSFTDGSDLKAKAGQWLEDPYKTNIINLSSAQCEIFNATKEIRNFLAHRSNASLNAMQNSLSSADLPNTLRRTENKVHSVGSFLDSIPTGGTQKRIKDYLAEVRSIANHIWP